MVNRILSLGGWLGTALVFVAVAIRFGYPAKEQYAFYLAWAGLVCVLAYTLGQWREIAKVFSRRQTRYGTLAATSVLIVLGILIAINYIGARQNKRWDLTVSKQFSLSDQSRNVLTKLDSPLQVLVFAQEPEFPRYRDKLREYEYVSKKVTTEYIDPDKKPTVAKQNQIQQFGTIVFNYKGRTERVTADNEQDITNGIIKVVSGQQRKIYFTQGHGEKDTVSAERDGYNAIAAALGRENYTVDKVVIAQQGAVPDDASIVIVAGPRTDFFAPEVEALKKYLDKSGKLLLELDPPDKVDSPPLTNLIALAHDWGIQVGNNVVVDVSGMGRLIGTDASVPVAQPKPGEADAPKPETRVAVFGDSDFAANGGLGIQGNRDLFMNTVGWLSQQENLISIRPKEADDRRITLTATQQSNITWLSLLIIPGFVFATGVFTWWRRR